MSKESHKLECVKCKNTIAMTHPDNAGNFEVSDKPEGSILSHKCRKCKTINGISFVVYNINEKDIKEI